MVRYGAQVLLIAALDQVSALILFTRDDQHVEIPAANQRNHMKKHIVTLKKIYLAS